MATFELPDVDLKDWAIVDAVDGRRWIGQLMPEHQDNPKKGYTIIAQPPVVHLQPAFEMLSRNTACVPVPVPSRVGGPPQMSLQWAPFNALDCLSILDMKSLPAVEIRWGSITRLRDFEPADRALIRRALDAAKQRLEEKT